MRPAQRRLFEAPRARLELYDLAHDPWELRNVADDPAYAKEVRLLADALQQWIEQSDDFPASPGSGRQHRSHYGGAVHHQDPAAPKRDSSPELGTPGPKLLIASE